MLDRVETSALTADTAAPSPSLAGRQVLFFSLVAVMMAGLLWLLTAAL